MGMPGGQSSDMPGACAGLATATKVASVSRFLVNIAFDNTFLMLWIVDAGPGRGSAGEVHDVRPFRFRALIALKAAAPGHHPKHYGNPTRALMLRAANLRSPRCQRFFSAEIAWEDQQPLRPGDRAVVTVTLVDEDTEMFFAAGQRFSLWNGSDIGYGTISRQIFRPAGG